MGCSYSNVNGTLIKAFWIAETLEYTVGWALPTSQNFSTIHPNQDLRRHTTDGGKGALRFANTPYWRDTAKIVE